MAMSECGYWGLRRAKWNASGYCQETWEGTRDQAGGKGESCLGDLLRRFSRRQGRSGDVGAIGRDHAADHSASDFGVNAGATRGFGLDHPPGAAIGQQGRQYRMVELVAAAHRTLGAGERDTR